MTDKAKYAKQINPIMQHFEYEHLALDAQELQLPICELAKHYFNNLPDNEESRAGLRKLLEAKDCFIRSHN